MDLTQSKLTKSEWISIEVSVSDQEKQILQLIIDGYVNPNIKQNHTLSLFSYIKVENTPEMNYYLFQEYFSPIIHDFFQTPQKKSSKTSTNKEKETSIFEQPIKSWLENIKKIKVKTPNKADMIRIQKIPQMISGHRNLIFDFVLIDFCKNVVCDHDRFYYMYSLIQMKKASIQNINKYVEEFVDLVIRTFNPHDKINIRKTFELSYKNIEKNPYLLKYEDQSLYCHQKQLFEIFGKSNRSRKSSKLVLYTAPTGTGKTLSPIGLAQEYRIIFVCVARHIGLALAKNAISMGKRVAFAFGCETASDIRLHYFAAANYKTNAKSGGIGKVDNSVGTKVEIMICDVASYLPAMYYMLAFHNESDIITYWDEPTITMDYETHELHGIIHRNWTENKISKVVLSCATLPKQDEIYATIHDFKTKFSIYDEEMCERIEPQIYTIQSSDFKKTISLLNKENKVVLPHTLFSEYRDVIRCVDHCEINKTLLRYFDVEEIVRFIMYVDGLYIEDELKIENKFASIAEITMSSLKMYYLEVLRNLNPDNWVSIHRFLMESLRVKFELAEEDQLRKIQSQQQIPANNLAGTTLTRLKSVSPQSANPSTANPFANILLTTQDAHTLTDGPTIYLAEDTEKIGKFLIQQSKIPDQVFASITEKIEKNNILQKRITTLEKEIEDKTNESATDKKANDKKSDRMYQSKELQPLVNELERLREQIQLVQLRPTYIPNTSPHQEVWVPPGFKKVANAFVPSVDEEDVRAIMSLNVDNQHKLLLIMGIGVFKKDNPIQYMEIMKRLAIEQRLFLIIASSDYIYGTNYQFCHGFIGKDLANMTQQKTIQAIGRIGRNGVQQEYSVRFRDEKILEALFKPVDHNLEAIIMSRLFVSDDSD